MRQRWERLVAAGWVDTLAVVALALLVAGPRLGDPAVLVFDEIFYVRDALSILDAGVASSFTAHPPLGSFLIAAGIALVGDGPAAWRLGALISGAVSVALLHRAALRLASAGLARVIAAAAALLLVADGTWLVLSRTAMLDGPLAAATLWAFVAATAAAHAGDGRRRALWSAVAGIAVGVATAAKWSGALAGGLVVVGLLLVPREDRDLRRVVGLTGLTAVIAVAVYGAAWVPYARHRADVPVQTCPAEAAPCGTDGGLAGVLDQHASLIRYHTSLTVDSPLTSDPSGWPLMQHPVGFYRPDCHVDVRPPDDPVAMDNGCPDELPPGSDTILFGGNPVLWFGFVALAPVLAAAARSRRDRAPLAVLVGHGVLWLPWLLATRSAYLWYMAPVVPFMALGLALSATYVPRTDVTRTYLGAAAGATAGALLALLPGVPFGVGIAGWVAGGATGSVAAGPSLRASRIAVATIVVVSLTVAAVMRGTWTAVSP